MPPVHLDPGEGPENMRRWNAPKLLEKPIKEQAEILWLAFEDLCRENLFELEESPTQEEIDNQLMVLVQFCAHIFKLVLSQTVGNVREEIAKSWILVIDAALKARRMAEQIPQDER